MIQGGRGGIYRYVIELARRLAAMPGIALSLDCVRGDEHLLGGLALRPVSRWARAGACDLARVQLATRAPAGGVLHAPSYRRVPWRAGGACVATVHDLAPLHMPEKYGFLRHQFLKRLVPVALRRCDRILTVTEHTKADLVDAFAIDPQRIVVTPNGIDHARLRPGDRAAALAALRTWKPQLAEDFVLYASRIEHPGKGHVALLDAWARLAAPGRDLPQLVFAGAAVERADEVFAHAAALGLKPLHVGFVPEALLPEIYRACRLFVFPSRYEGFGLPPVEAMTCGAAVASSRAGALAETAGPAAVLDPDDPEQMAATIGRLIDDGDERARLAGAGIAWAARFDWDATARATADVYRSVA